MLRILALFLGAWAITSVVRTVDSWRGWEFIWSQLAEWEEAPELWIEAWVPAVLFLSFFAAALMLVTAVGLWRRSAGAWMTAIAILSLGFFGPLTTYLTWGANALRAQGLAIWVPVFIFWLLLLWFLVRQATRETVAAHRLKWKNPWMAAIVLWLLVAMVQPLALIGLKFHLYRDQQVPFWSASGPLQEIPFQEDDPEYRDWTQVQLFDVTFAVPPETTLLHFPPEKDQGLGMVAMAAGSGGERQTVIVDCSSWFTYATPSVREQLGVSDGVSLARAVLSSNWSYWLLAFRMGIGEDTVGAFWMEDNDRQVIATVSPTAKGSHVRAMMNVKQHGSAAASTVIYAFPVDRFEPRRIAGLAARLRPADADDHSTRNRETTSIEMQLRLLREYWNGDVEGGVELAKTLFDQDEYQVYPLRRLIDRILLLEPDHAIALSMKSRLEEEKPASADD